MHLDGDCELDDECEYSFSNEGDALEELSDFFNELHNFIKGGKEIDLYEYGEYIEAIEECDSWKNFFGYFFKYFIDDSSLGSDCDNLNSLEKYETIKERLKK